MNFIPFIVTTYLGLVGHIGDVCSPLGNVSDFPLYDLSSNPAWVYLAEKEKYTSVWIGRNSTNGDFRKPFDPKKESRTLYHIDWFQPFKAPHTFKGSFEFVRDIEEDVMWAIGRDRYSGNPFIIADSSTGGFDITGISLDATYSRNLFNNYSIGLSLTYCVDNGLKRVFPKPELLHRDINTLMGVGYHYKEKSGIGIFFSYTDNEENINLKKYEFAEGVPELYKFRGFDKPIVLYKESENRLNKNRILSFGVDLAFMNKKNEGILLVPEIGKRNLKVTDGGTNPQPQGRFEDYFIDIDVLARKDISGLNASLTYSYRNFSQSALHPEFNVEIVASDFALQEGGFLVTHDFRKNIIGLQYKLSLTEMNRMDHYNRINYNVSASKNSVGISSLTKLGDWIELGVSYAFSWYRVSDSSISTVDVSDYYLKAFYPEFVYYLQDVNIHNISLLWIYHYGPIGDIILKGIYKRENASLSPDVDCIGDVRNTLGLQFGISLFIF